jgi:glycosyltransferase involved in cell wall biosynthesis
MSDLSVQNGISVVLPIYNELENLETVFSTLLAALVRLNLTYEIVAVNDGSTDGSGYFLDHFQNAHLKVIHHPSNLGYGAAVSSGLSASIMPFVFYVDADGQFDFSELGSFYEFRDFDLVSGYRNQRSDSIFRILFSQLWLHTVNLLFGTHFKDLNCGMKMIRIDLVKTIIPQIQAKTGFFSAELLLRAQQSKSSIYEIPIQNHLFRKFGQEKGIKFKVMATSCFDLLRLLRLKNCNRNSDDRSSF